MTEERRSGDDRIRILVDLQRDQINVRCEILPGVLEGELEYAFYLLIDGEKTQVRWYEPSASYSFLLQPGEVGRKIQVRGFARGSVNQKKLLSAVSMVLNGKEVPPQRPLVEDDIEARMVQVEQRLIQTYQANAAKLAQDVSRAQNCLYAQMESLLWLQRRLAIKGQLPPLRGWAASPDVLLRLHTHIVSTRPRLIVEFGSGASTLVIADALRQNRFGRLVSVEHSARYGNQTLATLQAEHLQFWVDVRIGDLELWTDDHMNSDTEEKPSIWYPRDLLHGLDNVDLLWVDGPPGMTCLYSRYPALPALAHCLSAKAEVWMDDTVREEEKEICQRWARDYGFEVEYLPLEKGLGRLMRNSSGANGNLPSA